MNDVADIALPHDTPPRGAQSSSAVEQVRAAAEVRAAILVAQQNPRNVQAAIARMETSCKYKELAERAFYRYPRGTKMVTGPTIRLARELAKSWGNMHYGVFEVDRDTAQRQSQIRVWAWDLETNTQVGSGFIVPHIRDRKGEDGERVPEDLIDVRDVYENNANAGARRVRECIFNLLPVWYLERAKDLCRQTLEDGGGKPLQMRIADAVGSFAALGVREEQLARKLGRPVEQWDAQDVGELVVIYQSLKAGGTTREQEFPAPVVTVDDLTGADDETPDGDGPVGASDAQVDHVRTYLATGGIGRADTVAALLTTLAGRPVTAPDELSAEEADTVLVWLQSAAESDPDDLGPAVAELLDRPADQ